jgi:uncharacterized membrane protein YoaT (DUF817 family)
MHAVAPPSRPLARNLLADAITFTRLQFLSAIFGIAVFAILAATKLYSPIPRYDLILILCLGVQWLMIRTHLETLEELKVISLFHVLGLAIEVWKVRHGSWSYPDAGYLRIGEVPLYSGFMYSSVASYITQAWRRFDLEMKPLPPPWLAVGLVSAGYLNFFTNLYLRDMRWWVIGAVMLAYARTRCSFTLNGRRYWLPLNAAFILIALFIYIAENLGTLLGAWQYPNQSGAWAIVHHSKISSWYLLIIVSYIIVAWLKSHSTVEARSPNTPAATP